MTDNWYSDLDTHPALSSDLLAPPVATALESLNLTEATVFAIDPELADTAALTEAFNLPQDASANCVLVAGERAGDERIAACVVLASTKADVNKRVRKLLDVRKASFLPLERAVADSGMEYGGIGPIGLPENYRVLIDSRVVDKDWVILGSGIRASKLVVPGRVLASLPGAEVVADLAV